MRCEQDLEVEIDGKLLVVWYDLADPKEYVVADEDDNEPHLDNSDYNYIEQEIQKDLDKRGSYEDYLKDMYIDEQIDKRRGF